MPDAVSTAAVVGRAAPQGVLVSVLVLTYRRQDLLSACLDSLCRACDAIEGTTEIVVVDNGSPENRATAFVGAHCPRARVVSLPVNRGYAGGAAAGLAACRGEWILTVGDDAAVDPGVLAPLLAAGRAAPDIGAVAALMLFGDGREGDVINSAGLEVDRLGIATDRLLGLPACAAGTEVTEVFGASGGAALYRAAMLEHIGAFEASFVLYLEDADLAWRARRHGWRCVLAPAAVVHHHHSATTTHRSADKYFHVGRNRVRLLARNATTSHLRRNLPAIVAYDLAYVVYAAVVDRTLAPLRGRASGLRRWRTDRRQASTLTPVSLVPSTGLRGALSRNRSWAPPSSEPELR